MTVLLQHMTLAQAPADPSWLGKDERLRLASISDAQRAAQYLAGHCLARTLAAELSGGSGAQWRLVVGDDGRRRLKHDQFAPLFASISHVRDSVAVAVGVQPLGLDLEAAGKPRNWLALARSVFSPQEVRALELAPLAQQQAVFLDTWTLKEAWAKRSGLGLQRSTSKRCTAIACTDANPEAWLWRLSDGSMALAAWPGAAVTVRGHAAAQASPWRYSITTD